MKEIKYIDNPLKLQKELVRIRLVRRKKNLKMAPRIFSLSAKSRSIILKKTGGKCHICGIKIPSEASFHADHVKTHASGGKHNIENFLPACPLCNNYRWHYSPAEMQWVLKIGVWARAQMEKGSDLGQAMTESFISHEKRRVLRRTAKVIKNRN